MDELKNQVSEYTQIKEQLKKLMDRKKELEQIICSTMNEHEVSTIELSNGTNLNYNFKESLKFSKEKPKQNPKSKSKPKSRKKEQHEEHEE
jgi:hypothetical protein